MADPTDLITVAEVKTSLRIPAATNTWDADLGSYITAATPVIEDITGPVIMASRSRTFDGGENAVLLPCSVVTVDSVTENGQPITDFTPNLASGIVFAGDQLALRPFFLGRQNIVVTFTAGDYASTADVPEFIKLATRELIRHWWQQGQQGQRPTFGNQSPDSEVSTPSGFAVPRRVVELLAPRPRMPGFA